MTEQNKVTVDDIIGIVKTEEQTNSVEEVRKLRGRENKTAKRFMIDDAGTLIDMHTRDTFDYVSDVCDLLNEQHETIQRLKKQLESEHIMLDNAILIERTRMGQNSLKQYKEAIQ